MSAFVDESCASSPSPDSSGTIRVASTLLATEGDDALLAEARILAEKIDRDAEQAIPG